MGDIPSSKMLPPPLIPSGYNSSVIWVPTIPSVEDEAIEKICILLLFEDKDAFHGEIYPSIAILHTKKRSKALAKKLIKKNPNWSGPHEDTNYNGSEADIIVYISDESMNIQTLARARRLLIILTCETECNLATNLLLKQAVSQNMAELMISSYCPDEMTKCNECGSIYNHIQNDQCPDHEVKCPNSIADGCEWKGLPGLHEAHIEDCEYCCDIRNDLHQRGDLDTSTISRSIPFHCSITCCMILLVVIILIAILSTLLVYTFEHFGDQDEMINVDQDEMIKIAEMDSEVAEMDNEDVIGVI